MKPVLSKLPIIILLSLTLLFASCGGEGEEVSLREEGLPPAEFGVEEKGDEPATIKDGERGGVARPGIKSPAPATPSRTERAKRAAASMAKKAGSVLGIKPKFKPTFHRLKRPTFRPFGIKYLLTFRVDHPEKGSMKYFHLFDSEGTFFEYVNKKVRSDYRLFYWNGYEYENFRYKRGPEELRLFVSSFEIVFPSEKAWRTGARPYAIASNTFFSHAKDMKVKKGDRFLVRFNNARGLPRSLSANDYRIVDTRNDFIKKES